MGPALVGVYTVERSLMFESAKFRIIHRKVSTEPDNKGVRSVPVLTFKTAVPFEPLRYNLFTKKIKVFS
jgi:hypothetical protein